MSIIDIQNKIEPFLFGYEPSSFVGYLINVDKGCVINEKTHRICHSINHDDYCLSNSSPRVMVKPVSGR